MYVRHTKVPGDDQHNQVIDNLENLDSLRIKVLIGFAIFWSLWLIAVVVAWGYYIGF